MNLPFKFARRYLFSKKNKNAINVITGITIFGFAVGTAALIIVLSVFNGFQSLVVQLYNSFDSDIQITAATGKVFDASGNSFDQVKKIEGIAFYNEVLEENVLLRYKEKQTIATMKGVSEGFQSVTGMDSMITGGELIINDTTNYISIGSGIASKLEVDVSDVFTDMEIFVPRREKYNPLDPENSFNKQIVYPTGIFAIQQELDEKYIVVPLHFAQKLLDYEKQRSSVELYLKPGTDKEKTRAKVARILGGDFNVKNRYQQHASLYKLMNAEKWAVYMVLTFILFIVSLNLVGALMMLVIEKQKDLGILNAMGGSSVFSQNIIRWLGLLITMIGCFMGLAIGLAISYGQQTFGWLKLGGGTFVVDAYPVHVQPWDTVLIIISALGIGLLATLYPAKKAVQQSPAVLNQR